MKCKCGNTRPEESNGCRCKRQNWFMKSASCTLFCYEMEKAKFRGLPLSWTPKHQYLYKVLLYSRNRSHLFLDRISYLPLQNVWWDSRLAWTVHSSQGPMFSDNRQQPTLLSNQFSYPQEDKNHNASRLHYYSSFEISLPCTSTHLKSYCREGCMWRHLHSM